VEDVRFDTSLQYLLVVVKTPTVSQRSLYQTDNAQLARNYLISDRQVEKNRAIVRLV
jgi:hypothetical protein